MKVWYKATTFVISSVVASIALALGLTTTPDSSIKAVAQDSKNFYCETAQGIPVTFYRTDQTDRAIIRWDSTYFVPAGYSPDRRCREVTARLNTYFRDKSEWYITHGQMNNQPVLCITDREGGSCTGLLYTLKPYQNPEVAIDLLIQQIGSSVASSPLREAPCRTYVNFRDALEGRSNAARKICR